MDILLEGIIPFPLRDNYSQSGVWGRRIEIKSGLSYLVNAPSGNGKSTLLSYMYGLRKDYEGRIMINGKDAKSSKPVEWSKYRQMNISMVFQDLRLFGELTAWQNIQVKRKLANAITDEDLVRMAETLGVSAFMHKQVKFLSMGQQQRVAIIRALVQPFKWLLLDEPFSHIDKDNISKAERLIREVCARNGAGVVTTTLGEHYDLSYNEVLNL